MHYGYLRLTKSSTLDLGPQTSLCDIRHNCGIICLLDYIDRSMGVASPSLLHACSNDREVSIRFSTRYAPKGLTIHWWAPLGSMPRHSLMDLFPPDPQGYRVEEVFLPGKQPRNEDSNTEP